MTGFNRIFLAGMVSIIDPIQSFLPFKPFFHFMQHMMTLRIQSPRAKALGKYNPISSHTFGKS
jgi:hypothetical protein